MFWEELEAHFKDAAAALGYSLEKWDTEMGDGQKRPADNSAKRPMFAVDEIVLAYDQHGKVHDAKIRAVYARSNGADGKWSYLSEYILNGVFRWSDRSSDAAFFLVHYQGWPDKFDFTKDNTHVFKHIPGWCCEIHTPTFSWHADTRAADYTEMKEVLKADLGRLPETKKDRKERKEREVQERDAKRLQAKAAKDAAKKRDREQKGREQERVRKDREAAKQKQLEEICRQKHAEKEKQQLIRQEKMRKEKEEREGKRKLQKQANDKVTQGLVIQKKQETEKMRANKRPAKQAGANKFSSPKRPKKTVGAKTATEAKPKTEVTLRANQGSEDESESVDDAEWLTDGHKWLDQRATRYFMDGESTGTICAWLPAKAALEPEELEDDMALWRFAHDDGDQEELDEGEVREALANFADLEELKKAPPRKAEQNWDDFCVLRKQFWEMGAASPSSTERVTEATGLSFKVCDRVVCFDVHPASRTSNVYEAQVTKVNHAIAEDSRRWWQQYIACCTAASGVEPMPQSEAAEVAARAHAAEVEQPEPKPYRLHFIGFNKNSDRWERASRCAPADSRACSLPHVDRRLTMAVAAWCPWTRPAAPWSRRRTTNGAARRQSERVG
jgi:hypothetical protein